MDLAAPQHVESSWPGYRTHVPSIGRQILNNRTIREVPSSLLFVVVTSKIEVHLHFPSKEIRPREVRKVSQEAGLYCFTCPELPFFWGCPFPCYHPSASGVSACLLAKMRSPGPAPHKLCQSIFLCKFEMETQRLQTL